MKEKRLCYSSFSSPLGTVWAAAVGAAITDISIDVTEEAFLKTLGERHGRPGPVKHKKPFRRLFILLEEYFSGRPVVFDVTLNPSGSAFDLRVWKALREVPWGKTASYGLIAARLGTGARAVGGAASRNPLPIVIPCHRIIKSDGTLGGYSGGTATKRALLAIEGVRSFT